METPTHALLREFIVIRIHGLWAHTLPLLRMDIKPFLRMKFHEFFSSVLVRRFKNGHEIISVTGDTRQHSFEKQVPLKTCDPFYSKSSFTASSASSFLRSPGVAPDRKGTRERNVHISCRGYVTNSQAPLMEKYAYLLCPVMKMCLIFPDETVRSY